MSKPKKIPIEKYDYPLPNDRIAKYPLADRDDSKVLVYRPGTGTKSTMQKQYSQVQGLAEEIQDSKDAGRIGQKKFSQLPGLSEKRQASEGAAFMEEKQFFQVPELLEESDLLYFNATRVVQARLVFRKETGARIEIFCLEPHIPADHQLAFSSTHPVEFICLVGNAKKWKEGKLTKVLESKETGSKVTNEAIVDSGILVEESDTTSREQGKVEKEEKQRILSAEITGRQDDKFIVRFEWNIPTTSFGEILECSGSTPIPPYLNREADKQDATTYQTIYARQNGSVAAPTAGLHFTKKVLGALDQKGVNRHELILHVGAGTFIPVKEKNAVNHQMHAELVTVDRSLLESLLSGDRKIAVGTTTTRSLESIYWLGVKAISSVTFSFDNLFLDQWDAYEMGASDRAEKGEQAVTTEMKDRSPLDGTVRSSMEKMEGSVPLEKAVRTLLTKMDQAGTDAFSFHTRLMITPGYRFRVIGGLFTNFHQPKSTLLLLIAAVAGDDWRRIYEYALENDFRFLSYGDGSLLFL